jgi:hypothetical protein
LRGDVGILEPLLRELEMAGDNAGPILFEAAVEAGKRLDDTRLCQALSHLETFSTHFGYDEDLKVALYRCNSQHQ